MIRKYPLLVGLGLTGLVLAAGLFVAGMMSLQRHSTSSLAALPAPAATTTVLTGIWRSASTTDIPMTALIDNGKITVNWETGDTIALYWQGTFPLAQVDGNGPVSIDSKGDTAAMNGSLMASSDPTKTFVFEKGRLVYSVTAMGVTSKVHLKHN